MPHYFDNQVVIRKEMNGFYYRRNYYEIILFYKQSTSTHLDSYKNIFLISKISLRRDPRFEPWF